jgi:hypothetical protein
MITLATPTPEVLALRAKLSIAEHRIKAQEIMIQKYEKIMHENWLRQMDRDTLLEVLSNNVKGEYNIPIIEFSEELKHISELEKENDMMRMELIGRVIKPGCVTYNCPVRVEKVSENETRIYLFSSEDENKCPPLLLGKIGQERDEDKWPPKRLGRAKRHD